MSKETIFVGLSGGVDSAVSLALLKSEGHDVRAVFMRNWSEDLPGFKCPWREDWLDAQSVALSLDTKIDLWDFEKDYRQKVVDYLLNEYRRGRTPNPDIICNEELKFKVFLNQALEQGASKVATGHYARIEKEEHGGKMRYWLKMARDKTKDQSYFLARVNQAALSKTLFPLGELEKSKVREIAMNYGLPNANKKDSVGICFIGEVGIKDFLKNFLDLKPGQVIDIDTNEEVGRHEGSELYTIGQRHGLDLNSGDSLPLYVVRKDVGKNIIFVSNNLNQKDAWTVQINLSDCHLPTADREELSTLKNLSVRTRHLGELYKINELTVSENGEPMSAKILLDAKIKSPAPGQSAVIYDEQERVVLAGFID